MNPVHEAILSYCRAGPGWVQMVTQRQLDRQWKRDGQPGPVPDVLNHEEMAPVAAALWARSKARAMEALRASMRPASSLPARPAARAPIPQTKEGDEAKVAVMKGSEARAIVERLGLAWPGPHPTNPGITAMRAKNAVATFIRRGGSL